MDIPSRVELPRSLDDLLLQLLQIRTHRWFYEKRRGWPSSANNNALINKMSARSTNIVFNGFCITSQAVFAFDPIVFPTTEDIRPWRNLFEEVTSVEVSVCLP